MFTATLTEKSQVVIPKKIRDQIDLKPKETVFFEVENERIVIRKVSSIDQMAGIFAGRRKKPLSQKEMNMVVRDAVVKKYLEKKKNGNA